MSTDEPKSRGHGEKKSRRLDQFLQALLHSNVEAAAKAAGVSRATAFRWMRDQTVLERLREARRNVMQGAMEKLQENAAKAVDNLDELQRTAESEAVRLSASRANLEYAFKAVETCDVLARLDEVERILRDPDWRTKNESQSASPAPARTTRGANGHA
jgi:hypothetical protein